MCTWQVVAIIIETKLRFFLSKVNLVGENEKKREGRKKERKRRELERRKKQRMRKHDNNDQPPLKLDVDETNEN